MSARLWERPGRSPRGIALLAVLWVLLPLSLLAAILLSETRTEARFARTSIEVAEAEAIADAGIYRAVAALLATDPRYRLAADGRLYRWWFGESELLISIQDEAGKIDLNFGSDDLLRGLLVSAGVAPTEAQILVDRIRDFADPDQLRRLMGAEDEDYLAAGLEFGAKDWKFASVDELYQVLGMPAELVARVAKALTVHSAARGLDPWTAPREALMALPTAPGVGIDGLLAGIRPRFGDVALLDDGEPGESSAIAGARAAARPAATSSDPETWLAPGFDLGLLRASGGRVFTVRAEAASAGARFVREAIVELTRDPARPFVIHEWRRDVAPPPEPPD